MKKCLVVAASIGLLCGFLLLAVAWLLTASGGQSARGQSPAAVVPVQNQDGTTAYGVVHGFGGYAVGPGGATQSEIGRLMNQLRETSDEAKKAELTKKLEAAVTKSFDEDMKARDAELLKMEERLKKLKEQMERRHKAKADIIQLQLKVLVNEAEGLGFSRTSAPDGVGRGPNYTPITPAAESSVRTPTPSGR